MSCCCKKILDLCRVTSCLGKLSLGVAATQTGTYTLECDFLNSVFKIPVLFSSGDNLEFPLNGLNENYVFIARIYGPDNTLVKKTIEEVEYECFSFETVFMYAIANDQGFTGNIIELTKASFDESGVYLGDVTGVTAVFHTGIPNFLKKTTEWNFVEGGIQILVGISDEDIIYLFK